LAYSMRKTLRCVAIAYLPLDLHNVTTSEEKLANWDCLKLDFLIAEPFHFGAEGMHVITYWSKAIKPYLTKQLPMARPLIADAISESRTALL
ncbi:hypothetical protein Tco_1433559, partial [Tanacetum coccineum]